MKNNLTILILLLITVFVSCKKDTPTSKASLETSVKNPSDGVMVKPLVVQPNYTYVDMILDPRPAGQNYDTYHATFGGIALTISSLYWDSTTYPNLVNGVPAYGTVSLSNNSVTVTLNPASGNGIGGAQYTIAESLGTGFTSPKLPDDIQKYENALNPDTIRKLNYIPSLDEYVKGDYGGNSNTPLRITNIRIIRCTTGTHFGVASASYPFPPISHLNDVNSGGALAYVYDPADTTIRYTLYGINGKITGYAHANGYVNPNEYVSGNYTAVPNNSTNYHCVGYIYRSDGTSFAFDVTMDIT